VIYLFRLEDRIRSGLHSHALVRHFETGDHTCPTSVLISSVVGRRERAALIGIILIPLLSVAPENVKTPWIIEVEGEGRQSK
jgi:hypothetical protein